MKKKYIAYAALGALGLGIAGFGIASAHGMGGGFGFGEFMGSTLTPQQIAQAQTNQFQKIADLLGISVDDVKNAWAKGESISQIAQEHGVTTAQLQKKIQAARQTQIKSQLDTLVSQGVITQDQESQRLQFMQNQAANMQNHMGRMGHHNWFF